MRMLKVGDFVYCENKTSLYKFEVLSIVDMFAFLKNDTTLLKRPNKQGDYPLVSASNKVYRLETEELKTRFDNIQSLKKNKKNGKV